MLEALLKVPPNPIILLLVLSITNLPSLQRPNNFARSLSLLLPLILFSSLTSPHYHSSPGSGNNTPNSSSHRGAIYSPNSPAYQITLQNKAQSPRYSKEDNKSFLFFSLSLFSFLGKLSDIEEDDEDEKKPLHKEDQKQLDIPPKSSDIPSNPPPQPENKPQPAPVPEQPPIPPADNQPEKKS